MDTHVSFASMSAKTLTKPTPELVPPPPANDGFDGKVRCPSLADLVQLECLSGARAALEVISNGRYGQLFFEHGALVHALTDQATGEEAALEILGWRTGTFGDADAVWPSRTSIQLPWQELLMRAAQISDERQAPVSEEMKSSGSRLVAVTSSRSQAHVSSVPPARASVVPTAAPPSERQNPRASVLPTPRASNAATERVSSVPPVFASVAKKSVPPVQRDMGRAARLDAQGKVLGCHGEELEEFVDLAAYLHRLVTLIGEDLGLRDFRELVWDRESSRLTVQAEQGGAYVAVEAPKGSDISALRHRLER